MYSKTVWNKQRYCRQFQNHVRILNFRRSNWKITMLGKSSSFFVVLRYGRSCQEMCGTILWVGKQDDSTTLQSINSMHWWRSIQIRRIEIRGRIVKRMLSNCSEMLVLCTYWTTSYSIVSEQTCTIDHKMDQSLWQTIISFDLYKQYCHVGNTAKQCRLGLFQDSDFAGDLEDSKSTSGRTLCIFGSHTFVPISWCVRNKFQFRTVQQNQKSFPWTLDWDQTGFLLSIYGIWSSQFLETRIRVIKHGEICARTNLRFVQHLTQIKTNSISWNDLWYGQCWFYFLKRQFFSPGSFVVCVWRQRSSDQDDYKGKKPDNDMFPETTELPWIGCSIETIWTPNPNQIHWHQKPTRWHADEGKFHTWWIESSFVFV